MYRNGLENYAHPLKTGKFPLKKIPREKEGYTTCPRQTAIKKLRKGIFPSRDEKEWVVSLPEKFKDCREKTPRRAHRPSGEPKKRGMNGGPVTQTA